ncbi:MAG TPA: FtsQ-type POTRA domain-containing protein [Methylomirabilota bacterium]|nr:FtsQ-type POTRA domain-containing protein [Methylomirabilota bacterium]
MRGRTAVLSPRGAPRELEDLAEKGRLIAGQRVARGRVRRRLLRRARVVAVRVLVVGVATAAVAGAGLGARWLLTSPRFAVREIEIRGAERLGREAVLAAAGLAPGMNLFRVDPQAVAGRLEALPLVRRAEVIRDFPDRVTVVVEERQPFTLVHAGRLHWIDEQGMDLGLERRAVTLEVPVITGLGPGDLSPDAGGPPERVAAGVSLLRVLLRSGSALLGQISEIDVSRPDAPVLYTVDGVEVRLGAEDWEARLGRLLGVLAQLRAAGEVVTSIDLRFRDQVVLKTTTR